MPELPEVECVRRSLERLVVGRRVEAVRVTRPGVIRGSKSTGALLGGGRIDRVLRHGKQLAMTNDRGRCVCVHLGMSGQLCTLSSPGEQRTRPADIQRLGQEKSSKAHPPMPPHTHVVWQLDGGLALRFTDPRRFGGLWAFPDLDQLLAERWALLGPDALTISPGQLHKCLSSTRRALKAALLDQGLVAGLGNIYVDELLFGAGLHPMTPATTVNRAQAGSLIRRMRTLLLRAVERGGSSLRDYVDADNREGSQQKHHRVYGRAGLVCRRRGCRAVLLSEQVAGRTTVWCPRCQKHPRGG